VDESIESGNELIIDKTGPIPYYHQLKLFLVGQIESGRLTPQQRLPSESEFCNKYNISRTVVRQALKELKNEGFLTTEKGKGTFVAKPKIIEGLVQSLAGFYEDLKKRGYRVTSGIIGNEVTAATHTVALALKLKPEAPVIKISRLRMLNNEPSVFVTTYIPQVLCPGLLDEDLKNKSLYALLEEKYGYKIEKSHRYIGVSLANEYEAELLNIDVGAPLLELESVGYLQDGSPVEYFHSLHRGDRTKFEVELVRLQSIGQVKGNDGTNNGFN
jgi:GntR family transcriptional regulator